MHRGPSGGPQLPLSARRDLQPGYRTPYGLARLEGLEDGALVVELSFAGEDWLVREVLKEAGDAAVLEPPAAREAVRRAVARLQVAARA